MRKNIYIPEDKEVNWEELEKVANELDRSISYLVNKAIEEFLAKHKKK